jgi:hypothetical protein
MDQSNYCILCKVSFKSDNNLIKHYKTKTHLNKKTIKEDKQKGAIVYNGGDSLYKTLSNILLS